MLNSFNKFNTIALKEAANSKHADVNKVERLIGLKMIKIEETMATKDQYISGLNNKRMAFVMSELRIKMISMKICLTHPNTRFYIADQKIHARPRAMGLSRTSISQKLKNLINTEIKRIQSFGLFDLWINRAMNRTRLKCIRTNDGFMPTNQRNDNDTEIMFTLNLLSDLFKVITSLLCVCILVVVIEINSLPKRTCVRLPNIDLNINLK